MALPHPPPHPALRDNGDRGGVRGRDGMGRDGMGWEGAVPCRAVPCRARRRLPGARPAWPWRQRLLGAAAGGPRAAPGGRDGGMDAARCCPPARRREEWRAQVRPCAPRGAAGDVGAGTGRSGGTRCPGPIGQELSEPVPSPSLPGRSPGVIYSAGKGRRGTALCGAAGAELSDGGLQVQLSKRVIQSTKGWVCSRSVQLDAGYLKWVFLTRLLKG